MPLSKPKSVLKIQAQRYAAAIAGTMEGRKNNVRHTGMPRTRWLSSSAIAKPSTTLPGTAARL